MIKGLASQTPMLLLPHGRDQNDNAVRVVARGAGLSLEKNAAKNAIQAACRRLLEEPEFLAAAQQLGALVAEHAAQSSVVEELEEAARVEGVSQWQIFWYVMLPLAKPMVVTVVIMQVLNAWNDFLLPLVITLANPAIRTLSVGIYAFKGEQTIDWTGMAAAATISIIPVVLLFILLQRYFINGLAGAVKG